MKEAGDHSHIVDFSQSWNVSGVQSLSFSGLGLLLLLLLLLAGMEFLRRFDHATSLASLSFFSFLCDCIARVKVCSCLL